MIDVSNPCGKMNMEIRFQIFYNLLRFLSEKAAVKIRPGGYKDQFLIISHHICFKTGKLIFYNWLIGDIFNISFLTAGIRAENHYAKTGTGKA